MVPSSADKPNYQSLSNQLTSVLAAFENGSIEDVDAAFAAYEKGLKLIAEMQAYLQTIETKINEHKVKLSPPS